MNDIESRIEKLIKIRLIVFQLGEIDAWWPTKIAAGQGVDYLSYSVPKTAQMASIQLSLEIARKSHDTQINYGQYHLFRLKPTDEEKIFDYIKSHHISFLKNDRSWLLNELNLISLNISIEASKSAVQVGSIDEIEDDAIIQSLARHYYEAFKADYKTFPYLN
ncbi:MAG TPA: BrxE family protein [Prolixibacteraceae bacterium]|nr:BrxE family protein [Prolixibacteraceae bacterium]